MLKTKVKVGSITNLSEARYCAGMGVDFLCFPTASVDPKTYNEITGWVAGPKFGIELNSSTDQIDQYPTDFIQVQSNNLDQISEEAKLIFSLSIDQWAEEKSRLSDIKQRILFLEFIPSAIDSTAISIIGEASKEFDLLLRLRNDHNISEILKLPIAGVSLEGSAEERAGLKEYPLAEILEKLEEE